MAIFDLIITGGRIFDGTGCPAYTADIGIIDGVIAKIGHLDSSKAKELIDAQGKIVAPGHVAQHAHYDVAIFWDPYLSNSGENGVTTVVNANCGFGVAPARPQDRERTMQMLETTEQIPVSHQRAALPWDWEGFPDYLARVRQLPKGVNILSYLPVNPLLIYVMGADAAKSRRPTRAEMVEIHHLINEAMDAGAIGISMSCMGAEGNTHLDRDGTPMPTDVVDHDAILDICQALVERGEGVIQLLSHLVIYGDRSLTEQLLELAKRQLDEMLPQRKFNFTTDYAAIIPARGDLPFVWIATVCGRHGDGLIDGLIHYRLEPDQRPLSDDEISNQLVCAMVSGMESVPKVTGGGLLELWRRPGQLNEVLADLDEREFDAPDDFTWNRSIPRVISFGLGQHHCIGKHLAQLEVRIMIHEFLTRVKSIDFALEGAGNNAGYFQRGWISLPVIINS